MDAAASKKRIVIVTPVLNDWPSLRQLLEHIAGQGEMAGASIHVLAVDDGSSVFDPPGADNLRGPIKQIQVLRLKANQGHQRAIALGLAYAVCELQFDLVVVMDSDGEDRPEELVKMLEEHHAAPDRIIVAQRLRRSEGLAFRFFYQVYKLVFRQMTGQAISFGNFSLLPAARVSNVLFSPGIWNNFAATILRARVPIKFVPTIRGKRYFGSSTMNFSSLVIHGMSAISVFSDIVVGRIFVGLCGLTALFAVAVLAIICGKIIAQSLNLTGYFIPGYTTNVILALTNIIVNALLIGLLTIVSLLASRSASAALPSLLLRELLGSVHSVTREIRAVGPE